MVDLMMVGNLGTGAISAVGLTTQPKFILMTMVMAMNVGATALVAQSKGAGNKDKANVYMRQAMIMNLCYLLSGFSVPNRLFYLWVPKLQIY